MNLKGKTYTDLQSGRQVKVIDNFEDVIILDNKEKVKLERILDKRFYEEFVDPKNFFSNQSIYDSLANKIKNIPSEQIKDEVNESVSINLDNNSPNTNTFRPSSSESAIILDDPEEEKRMLAEKAKEYARGMNNNISQNVNRQAELLSQMADEEAQEIIPVKLNVQVEEEFQNEHKTEIKIDGVEQKQISKEVIKPQQTFDPITQMFKSAKRNVDLSVKIDFKNKIPRLDFIEMMEDSYDTSIIDFLSDEFTEKIINDPSLIKEAVKAKIKEMVYGLKKEEKPVKSLTPKKVAVKKSTKKPAKESESLKKA